MINSVEFSCKNKITYKVGNIEVRIDEKESESYHLQGNDFSYQRK